ncbi:MAG: protein kinase [Thalassolituus sp.]|uniref:serine/threonine protein kinase n=1 Tax=Thalassolituus sp. TaxID=2030822 RepID=UPI0039828A75
MDDRLNEAILNLKEFHKIDLENIVPLATGGQKSVFKAYNALNGEALVLKLVKPSQDDKERTLREIRAASVINHSRVPKPLATNADSISSDFIYILEPYVSGTNLRDYMKDRKFSTSHVINFIDSMLDILKECEVKRIVHRDIKPENIIVDDHGNFWLIDFGISRHLDLESITNSAAQFAPFSVGYSPGEQFRNRKRETDSRSDLFPIGVIAYEMIHGYNFYINETNSLLEIIRKIENQSTPVLMIPGDDKFFLARYIKTLSDNRISRRPRNIDDAIHIFNTVKKNVQGV